MLRPLTTLPHRCASTSPSYTPQLPTTPPYHLAAQVLKYEPGQFYREHHDQNSPKNSAWGPRLYTFFMYLSEVEHGGETRFTRLNISVAPKKGSAILWPSVFSDDPWSTDERTYHEARTVDKGIKYSANFWIHMFEFQAALGRGCDNSDYYQDDMQGGSKKGANSSDMQQGAGRHSRTLQ